MTIPTVTGVHLGGSAALPLLVCGPSLGTSAVALWSQAADLLREHFHIMAWDLPGHGNNRGEVADSFTMAELADGVQAFVDSVLADRGESDDSYVYAGVSVGGAVGLRLLLDQPDRITTAVLACTAARIGDEQMWRDRAAMVRSNGTSTVVEASTRRWFAPGFTDRHPEVAAALLHSLMATDTDGYTAVCEALAAFDLRGDLSRIRTPIVALAGAYDVATPVSAMAELAHGVVNGRLVVLDRASHLAPAEAPADVANTIIEAAGIRAASPGYERASGRAEETAPQVVSTLADRRAAGMAVRRAVLGDAHVDRATANATDLTREFQEFITDYAWGGVWTRPGLDRRSRSMIVLTALIARGHHEELAMHLRAARTNGLTDDEIKELILQSAIYCGVPDANTAFRIAAQTLTAEPEGNTAR
ncbi:bifunctional 3-oxoadipate enol-lactonase/4-carboxymuconolactone decarboxylase PcaDC [Nocardia fluminea]|uniref:4-carboxymuconolactone decarboxylase /3-oxoadipate enol-lactonase n=1 Tax=Nocardia fluminea TaxID=134984 RepID=A0A2N3V5N7_9NOCA|nr:4-carboxymuconolactone decarboxylase [Nocardia fluminea]PKV76924.1 4-carboxymuconolactone decarboxylase /3-oxoadipate enol-lactonase [Nocardia fluminea]